MSEASRPSSRPAERAPRNLALIVGEVTADPEHRALADGVAVQFDVATTAAEHGRSRRHTVPVNWYDPTPAELEPVTAGAEVVVVGEVRRRFFRAGGVTQSRTEVVPQRVIPAARRRSVRSALDRIARRLS